MYRNEMPLKKEVFVEDIIDPIRFDTGVAKLAAAEIRQLETALQKYSSWDNKVRVIVAGHTDVTKLSASARNQYTDNHGLSLARAWEVANMIHSSLPSDVVIEVEGFGATKPVATNATRTGRALNRRVEVHFKIERQSKPEGIRLQEFQQQVVDYSIGIDAVFSEKDPLLQSGDQLTFVERSGWREVQQVTLSGEFTRPGIYVIDRGETLCSVVRRAGGLTSAAWSYGSEFTRLSTRKMQQQTLDGIQDQLDDLMMELSLSHSVNNDEKTPAAGDKDEYLKVLNRLKRAEPNGREVINLDKALTCDKRFDVILEGDDRLSVPVRPRQVSVMGQVYVPTSHAYINNRTIRDYIELSGGATVIGRLSDAYAVQANGEVLNMRGRGFKAFSRKKPEPGATIFVPLNVDRMNTTEKIQAWTRSLVEVALFAGVIL